MNIITLCNCYSSLIVLKRLLNWHKARNDAVLALLFWRGYSSVNHGKFKKSIEPSFAVGSE
jgi:hypothetical protein